MIINKFLKLIDKIINVIVIIILLLLIAFGGYAIYDSYYVYNGAKLSDDIKKLGPAEGEFSLESLQEINEDICGWVRIDDTNIDYPIVIGKDNTDYLSSDYKKEYSTSGSIFLDYRNNRDFEDDYSIIYGHNLEANLMFSNIKKYEDQKYFDNHSTGELYTGAGVYHIDIYCFARINAFQDEGYNLFIYANGMNSKIVDFFMNKATTKNTFEINKEDKLILLSTCDSAGTNDRSVLLGKLTKIDAEEIINKNGKSSLKKIDRQTKENNTGNINDSIAPSQTVRKVSKLNLSTRTIALIVLTIIVIIIFIILIVRKIKNKTNKKGKHSY